MITLIVNQEPPLSYSFDKASVTIGNEEGNADLKLAEETLLAIHVVIEEKEGQFFVINKANDPFVALNDLPFGKKIIQHGDILQIGECSFLFEGKLQNNIISDNNIEHILESKLEQQRELAREHILLEELHLGESRQFGSLEAEEPLAHYTYEKIPSDDLEQLLLQVESLEENDSKKGATQSETNATSIVHQAKEDEPLTFLESSSAPSTILYESKEEFSSPFIKKKRPYKWWVLAGLIIILSLLGFFLFGKWHDATFAQVNIEEIQAAEKAADVAMALMYAKIHKIQPQNHNWSDPHFLRSNLASILPPTFQEKNNWGIAYESEQSPYTLRIYTSNNLSRFVVIVQPKSSLKQPLFPRAAIAIDSEQMLLRKTFQFKELNRLMIDPDLFTKSKERQITELLHQFEIIPLEQLARATSEPQQYLPPKALALLRPGAENKIYNAPRYFLFGEALIDKASALFSLEGNASEMQQLDAEALTPLPDMVFYSSQGMGQAQKNQEILHRLSPTAQILTAYLRFNEGILHGSHLLIGDRSKKENPATPAPHIEKVQEKKPQSTLFEPLLKEMRLLIEEGHAIALENSKEIKKAIEEYTLMEKWDRAAVEKKQQLLQNLFDNWSLSLSYYEQEILSTFYQFIASHSYKDLTLIASALEEAGLGSWASHALEIASKMQELSFMNLTP